MGVPFKFDPYRVGMAGDSKPWAMPTAIEFHAFGVKNGNLRHHSNLRMVCGVV